MGLTLREIKGEALTHAEMDGNFKYLDGNTVVRNLAINGADDRVVPFLDVRSAVAPEDGTQNLALLFVKVEGVKIAGCGDSESLGPDMYSGYHCGDNYPESFEMQTSVLLHADNGTLTIASDAASGVGADNSYREMKLQEIETGLFGVEIPENIGFVVGALTVAHLDFVDLDALGVKVLP